MNCFELSQTVICLQIPFSSLRLSSLMSLRYVPKILVTTRPHQLSIKLVIGVIHWKEPLLLIAVLAKTASMDAIYSCQGCDLLTVFCRAARQGVLKNASRDNNEFLEHSIDLTLHLGAVFKLDLWMKMGFKPIVRRKIEGSVCIFKHNTTLNFNLGVISWT